MEEQRYWQSMDMTVSKCVMTEGDFSNDCGKFGATLSFEIFEIDIERVDFDSTILSDSILHQKTLMLRIGMASNDVDLALEQAFCSMYPGEKSRFDVSSVKVSGSDENRLSLHFVVQRTDDNTKNLNVSKWPREEKMNFAQESYDKAVSHIKAKNYRGAFKLFKQAATLTMFSTDSQSATDLRIRSLSNLTLCQRHLEKYDLVVEGVDVILDGNPNVSNAGKLIARRGQAEIKLQNYEKAICDLNQALILDPDNKATQSDLKQAKAMLKNHDAKMSNAMKKMFG